MNHTQTEKLKEHEQERDFFCVVSDAFRVFARRSSIMLGSAWSGFSPVQHFIFPIPGS